MEFTRRKFVATAGMGIAGVSAGCLNDVEQVEELPRPMLGNEDAPVTVEVYEDFACPACQQFQMNVMPEIREEYIDEGDVQFHHYDFPIPVDGHWSYMMAGSARAIQDRAGQDAYFDYKEILYDNQSQISEEVIRTATEDVSVEDVEGVIADAENEVYQPVLDSDQSHGQDRGVQGTPSVFVDDQHLPSYDYDTVSAAIESSLD